MLLSYPSLSCSYAPATEGEDSDSTPPFAEDAGGSEIGMCVQGDIEERLPAQLRRDLETLLLEYRAKRLSQIANKIKSEAKVIQRELAMEFLSKVKVRFDAAIADPELCRKVPNVAYCYKHLQSCLSRPPSAQGVVRIGVAGVPCTDWSLRGLQQGTLGKTCLPFLSFAFDKLIDDYDGLVLECVTSFDDESLRTLLGSKYEVYVINFTPTVTGVPAERHRKYMILLNRGTVTNVRM